MPNTRSARLASWQKWLLIISGSALLLTGAAWLLLHHFGQVEGEFGPEINPLEPWMLRLHGLALIPALLGFGGLFIAHIPKGWRDHRQRWIGLGLTSLVGLLIITGYLLYYAGGDDFRGWVSLIHWVMGLAVPLLFIWHYARRHDAQRGRQKTRLDQ
jgi:cytochrome c biogenesis protein CcdA